MASKTASSALSGKEDSAYIRDRQRVWDALDNEIPVIDESSKWGVRLYFLSHDLHIYLTSATGGFYSIFVSNMGKNHTYPGYRYSGENPGEEIKIEKKNDKGLLDSKVMALLKRLRKNSGINDFLKVVEINKTEETRISVLKNKYARKPVVNESEREQVLGELNSLLDIDMEKWTPEQADRIQQLAAALGYDPVYTAEKEHPDNWPSHPMDRNIYNIKQGDIIYIQYGVGKRNNEEEVTTEIEGYLQEIPPFGGKPDVVMTDGTKFSLNDVREIIVDEGSGGHYKVDKEAGGMDPWYFLMGGHLERKVLAGNIPEELISSNEGDLADRVDWINWAGINKYLPIKVITKHKITKKDAWVRMTGEKVTVLEAPGTQNNGVFMYKRSDGRFGDHDMVDINRIIILGIDSEVAQLSSYLFKKGDKVVIQGEGRFYYGDVEKFYSEAFIGRRMVVKLDNPLDPKKPYIHVKFVNAGEAILIGAKNQFTKTQLPALFKRLYETINTKLIISKADFLEQEYHGKALMDFWEHFKILYDVLFGSEGMFEKDDFNVKALDSVFRSGIGMSPEEMMNGIAGVVQLEPNNPLTLIGSLLDKSEKGDVIKIFREIRLGINLFAGQAPANTGTIPWVIKEKDLFQVTAGKAPKSDFTITALLRYFDNDIYSTFADRVGLAYQIASAREKWALEGKLQSLYENRDKVEGLSLAAKEIAAEEYTKGLQDLDDIGAVRLVLGLNPETDSNGSSPLSQELSPGGIDLTPKNLGLEVKEVNQGDGSIFVSPGSAGKNRTVPIIFDPATFQGFTFQILSIQPVKNLQSLLLVLAE